MGTNTYHTGRKLHNIAFWFLIIFSVVLLVFSLLSGAEESGILNNSMNALPWAILLVITIVGYKKPLIAGGLLLVFAGGLLLLFDNLTEVKAKVMISLLEIAVIIPAILFISSWFLLKLKKGENG